MNETTHNSELTIPVCNQSENDKKFKNLNSANRFNVYDGWNKLNCGALVNFKNQIPCSFRANSASDEDILHELVDLGFDGAKLDHFSNFISFDETIESHLIRLGLHCSCPFGASIALDFSDDDNTVIVYDCKYKLEISPVRLIRALSIAHYIPQEAFWDYLTFYKPTNWITEFQGYVSSGVVKVKECFLSMEDVVFILQVYSKLSKFQKECFIKWPEGDFLAMLEIAKRISATHS